MLDFLIGVAIGGGGVYLYLKIGAPTIAKDGKSILHNGTVYVHSGIHATEAEFKAIAAEIKQRFGR